MLCCCPMYFGLFLWSTLMRPTECIKLLILNPPPYGCPLFKTYIVKTINSPHIIKLLSLFETMVQSPGPLSSLRNHPLPAMLYWHQQVLDENHVLFLAEVFEVSALLVEVEHGLAVCGYFLLEGFVLFNLGCGWDVKLNEKLINYNPKDICVAAKFQTKNEEKLAKHAFNTLLRGLVVILNSSSINCIIRLLDCAMEFNVLYIHIFLTASVA